MDYSKLDKLEILTPRLSLKPFYSGLGEGIYEAVIESYDLLDQWKIWILNSKDKLNSYDYEQFGGYKLHLLKEGKDITLCIFNRNTAKFIGSVSINKINELHTHGYLGFWLRKSCLGKGYAIEAATYLINFVFTHLNYTQIKAVHEVGNIQSQKTLLSLGFVVENSTHNIEENNINPIKSSKWVYYILHR